MQTGWWCLLRRFVLVNQVHCSITSKNMRFTQRVCRQLLSLSQLQVSAPLGEILSNLQQPNFALSQLVSIRTFARLPGGGSDPLLTVPVRSARRPATLEQAAAATTSEPSISTSEALKATSEQAAAAASAWMFPWERRQMDSDSKGLRTWEKLYWGVFVSAMAFLLFSRLYQKPGQDEKEGVDEEREAHKAEVARAVLAGRSFTAEGDDVFEGLSPQQIHEYIDNITEGARPSDPFEGMSPEEINDYVAKHGLPAG